MNTSELEVLVCEMLAAKIPAWSWKPSDPYTVTDIGIFQKRLGQVPDRAVAVTQYDSTDSHPVPLSIRRVQLRFRGAPGAVSGADDLADAAFAVLQGLTREAGLSLITREIVAQLGPDENERQERADSYQIILDNTEA